MFPASLQRCESATSVVESTLSDCGLGDVAMSILVPLISSSVSVLSSLDLHRTLLAEKVHNSLIEAMKSDGCTLTTCKLDNSGIDGSLQESIANPLPKRKARPVRVVKNWWKLQSVVIGSRWMQFSRAMLDCLRRKYLAKGSYWTKYVGCFLRHQARFSRPSWRVVQACGRRKTPTHLQVFCAKTVQLSPMQIRGRIHHYHSLTKLV